MHYDLVDRRCVVTGASAGIGKEIARNLAYFGATVVLGCRDRDRGSAALQEIVEDSGNDHVAALQVDLSSQESIRSFARNLVAGGPVDVLVNNAAVLLPERAESADGHELTWATNALAYFMLTNLLLPTLRKSKAARVVNVASKFAGRLDLDDLEFTRRKYSGTAAYAQSKQANRMLTWGLQARLGEADLSVHTCHPGGVASELYREQRGLTGTLLGVATRFLRKPSEGAIGPTYLASAPEVHEMSGRFWIDRRPVRCKFRDPVAIDALWRTCVDMTHSDAT